VYNLLISIFKYLFYLIKQSRLNTIHFLKNGKKDRIKMYNIDILSENSANKKLI